MRPESAATVKAHGGIGSETLTAGNKGMGMSTID
jgi:hypothetical protein